ncbi:MAG: hypothetical protein WD872_18105 [Pirellulaceae bacterium]
MRRILIALALAATMLVAATPAQARHGRGWGGFGGYGGHRHGGYGWGGHRHGGYSPGWCGPGIGLSVGYYRPYAGYGFAPSYNYAPIYNYAPYSYAPIYGYRSFGVGYPNYPTPIGFYGSTYSPATNFASLYVSPLAARTTDMPDLVSRLVELDRTVVATRDAALAALGERDVRLPRIDAKAKAKEDTADRPVARRATTAAERRATAELLAQGDSLFREQNFQPALMRYKLAAKAAPDLAEIYWRQGHALVACGSFVSAGGAFKRAIALDADVRRDGFTLDALYGTAALAKVAHLETLAEWALEREGSPEPYFLIGITLAYDGQPERASKFFQRAAELAGVGGGHIAAFDIPREPEARIAEAKTSEPPRSEKEPVPALPVSAEVEI